MHLSLATGKRHIAEAMSPMVVRGLASRAASGGLHHCPSLIAVLACSSACRQLISILSPFDCRQQDHLLCMQVHHSAYIYDLTQRNCFGW